MKEDIQSFLISASKNDELECFILPLRCAVFNVSIKTSICSIYLFNADEEMIENSREAMRSVGILSLGRRITTEGQQRSEETMSVPHVLSTKPINFAHEKILSNNTFRKYR